MTEPNFDIIERLKEAANTAWVITALLFIACFYLLRNLLAFIMERMYGFFIQKR